MKKILFIFVGIILLSYGIFLRWFDLGGPSFWIDEGYSSLVGYFSYTHQWLPVLPGGGYEFSSYLLTLFQVISFSLFGVNDLSARIPNFFFGVLHIAMWYLLVNRVFPQQRGKPYVILGIGALLLFSTWQILWAREARFYELLGLFTTTIIYVFVSYLQTKETKYLYSFFLISIVGILFHYFVFSLFISGVLVLLFVLFQNPDVSKKKVIFGTLGVIVTYISITQGVRMVLGLEYGMHYIFPVLQSTSFEQTTGYFLYYIHILWQELGIIFPGFLLCLVLFISQKKYALASFLALIFISHLSIISGKSEVAHSRYIYHMMSICTVFGSVFFVHLFQYISQKTTGKYKNIVLILSVFIFGVALLSTYKMTFFPQKTYYIDATSPKPNFKYAYESLQGIEDVKIISGFPQLCYWYFLGSQKSCEYALNVNLTGSEQNGRMIQDETHNHYTQTPYLKNISFLPPGEYYFVLDDLTMKNAIDTHIIAYVKDNCQSVFQDIGNGELENFVGVWKCSK